MAGVVEQLRPHPKMKNQVILRIFEATEHGPFVGPFGKGQALFWGFKVVPPPVTNWL